ncbi:hypothetical protein M433DRAFT_152568 [Acidomyces richmondensis BFW]|nr:MAG: hypothetical protein FE78DRAFT_87839 [Acidomyces sp. 'richmondensis']KYG47153.1 hypothetical protein M433DRAFT_152568 [Acidomyces richmondensis BFW]
MVQPPVLYSEIRIPPTPSSSSSVLYINTSGEQSQRFALRHAGSKRGFDEISGLDEEAYARKHLATDGSVFFRSNARSPRSFLWRILEDRKLVEIQSVDLVRHSRHESVDGRLTFRLEFKDAILRHGVVFADPQEMDALECYVLTEGRDLYTVTLRRDLLARANPPAEFDPSTCVKRYSSSFLSVRRPYRFHAINSLELLVSLVDGGLVKLERKAHDHGGQWRETYFSEGGWAGALTLKKLNPFAHQHTVRYGDLELDSTAIADMAQSPDGKFVWTVSLDHYLRAWSTKTGKIALKVDILGSKDDLEGQKKQHSYVMNPDQGALLQLLSPLLSSKVEAGMDKEDAGAYSILLQSPKDHQFKIYNVYYSHESLEDTHVQLRDLNPTKRLIPPIEELMNTNIWHLERFHMQSQSQPYHLQLWIQLRSGTVCQIFTIAFNIEDGGDSNIDEVWKSAWTMVSPGPLTSEGLRHSNDFPGDLDVSANAAATPSEKWVEFLLYPGRFSTASIETALHIYRKGRGLPLAYARGFRGVEQPLAERLTSAICSKLSLQRLANQQPDYERYQLDVQTQWQTFYTLLSHLHNRRHESIGFSFDAEKSLPWGVCADYVAPIRACSGLEMRCLNTPILERDYELQVHETVYTRIYPAKINKDDEEEWESLYFSRLLEAARDLRESLSPSSRDKLVNYAVLDSLVPYADIQPGRAASIYEKAGFDAEVTDDDFEALAAGVESLGGLGGLKDDIFLGLLEWLDVEGSVVGRESRQILCQYGVRMTVEVANESLQRAQAIVFDIIALVVFMAGAFDPDELDHDFNADQMYNSAVNRLKRINLQLWLTRHTREQTELVGVSLSMDQGTEVTYEITLLEDVYIGDWRSLEPQSGPVGMPELLTIWSKAWLYGMALTDISWDGVTAHILALLLKRRDRDLAMDFLKFITGNSAWASYLKGRLFVYSGDYTRASIEFKLAAEGLSSTPLVDTANFLQPDELTYFGSGYAMYFQHITAVFEKLRIYSYVADFASSALQHTEPVRDFARSIADLDRKKHQLDSPADVKASASAEEARLLRVQHDRDEILNRLFNALNETGRYAEAYEALAEVGNPPMRRANLRKLLETGVKRLDIPSLLDLPFEGDLAFEADKVFADMVQKELSSGISTSPIQAYQVLYAFRTQRSDFRGAAEVLYEHLERLRHAPPHHAVQDPEDETLVQLYVLLINTLACCGDDDAWLLAEPIPGLHEANTKRRLVTLGDLRRDYAAELDKRSDMLHGRFAFAGEDEMDVL